MIHAGYPSAPSSLNFIMDGIIAIKITKYGIEFNREAFPGWTPDDFSMCFMEATDKYIKILNPNTLGTCDSCDEMEEDIDK